MANDLPAPESDARRGSGLGSAPVRAHKVADNGLTPAQERFAILVARGCSQRQAYVLSHGPSAAAAARARAAELAGNERVRERVRAIMRAAKIDDLDSVAQYHADLMRQIALAMGENNLTAVAALMRLRGQTIGVLQDKTIVTDERALPDTALVERLAKGDARKAAMLKAILGDEDRYKS